MRWNETEGKNDTRKEVGYTAQLLGTRRNYEEERGGLEV